MGLQLSVLELLAVTLDMDMERGKLHQRPRLSPKPMPMPPTAPTVIPVDPGARQELRGSASRGQCRTRDRCQGNTAGRWQLPTTEAMLMVDLVDLVATVASEVMGMGDTELFH